MDLEEIYKEVAKKHNIPTKVVKECYKQSWDFIREKIKALPLKDKDLTLEELRELRTSFSLPYLGNMSINRFKYIKTKQYYNEYISKRNKTNV